MPPRLRGLVRLALVLALALPAGGASAAGNAAVAALQVALQARLLYDGPIDGVAGPNTTAAVRMFQRRKGLTVDGVVGSETRAALGRYGRHRLGSRPLMLGTSGWDVAELQFLLAWHGFPSRVFDGRLGLHTAAALSRFQAYARLPRDGVAGPRTIAALHAPLPASPIALAWPLRGGLGTEFGPRGNRFHAGLDILAPRGTPVAAAGAGRVVWAGFRAGGWGRLVTIAHGNAVRTMYAHLSRADVRLGARVVAGERIGLVGATGNATGPHLHFEVRVRGAAVDPLTALAMRGGRT
ncbi:MAG TPA: peptidoglycan DD-metalloendopeptidase family protein [Gaiellaceae bacterium]